MLTPAVRELAPPLASSPRRSGFPRIVLVLAVGAIVLAGCASASTPTEAADKSSSTPFAEPDDAVTLGEIAIGECFNEGVVDPETGRIHGVFSVSCDGPHQYEMYGHEPLPDALGTPYPGDDAMAEAGDALCRALFADYVGISYQESQYWFWYYTPDAVTWDFLRRVDCALGKEDQSMLPPGSIRGSGE
jgi:Septum formation